MAKKSDKLVEETKVPEKQSIEDIVEEAEVLKAEAELQDAEEQKKKDAEAAIPEVEVDLDKEREKTKQETKQEIEKEIVEPLKQTIIDLQKTLAPQEKDDYDKFVEDYRAKNGTAPEWKEVATFLEDRAVQRMKDEQKADEDAKTKVETDAKTAQEEQSNNNFKIWQSQLDEMEKSGMLPKMEKAEVGDEGFDERVKLYALMQNTWNKTDVTPVTNMFEVFTKFYKKENKEKAGADAPVSLGVGSGESAEDDEFKYNEIHQGGKNLEAYIGNLLKKVGVGN